MIPVVIIADSYDEHSLCYSLFYQILGVAFFQFAPRCLKFFSEIFIASFFSFSLNFPGNLVEFCCVLWKIDHLVCNKFSKLQISFHHYHETRILVHVQWSHSQNAQ